jgi:DNA repair protein RecO (recombination protein O)
MPAEKARARVIRSFPFGDSSAVVVLYTRELGKVRALAKGAWRPKGSFDGALDLLSACQVVTLRKSSGGLDLLTEAWLDRRFRVGSMTAFHGGMHVAELLDALTAEADPQPELFDAADATLRVLSPAFPAAAPADEVVRATVARFELLTLSLTGHAPALDACAECRRPVDTAGRVAFGMLDGGALCPECRRGKRAVVSLSAGCARALLRLADPAGPVPPPPLPDPLDGEVRALLTTLLAHTLGRRPRVAPLLKARSTPTPRPSER